jgi:hypothetical protein
MDWIVSDQSNTTRQKQKSVVGDVVLALVCLLPVFYAVVVFFKQPLRYVELIAEDNIGETFTAVCFLGAGVIALATAYRRRYDGEPWFMLALFGLATLFIGGEEISWFSRLLGYSVPEVEHANHQYEVNLHNLTFWPNYVEALFGSIFLLLYGIALPLAVRFSMPLQRLAKRWAVPIPPMQTLPLFAAAMLFMLMDALPASRLDNAKGIEIGEMLFGLGALVTAAMFGHARDVQANLRAIRAIGLTLFISLLIVQFGPSKQLLLQRERRLAEFRDWRYPNMSLLHPAAHLADTDIALQRYAGVLGTSGSASYNRLLLLSDEKPQKAKAIAILADNRAQEDLILASINAAIASGFLDRDDAKRERLKDAEELIDQQLASGPPTANLIVLKTAVICLEEGAEPALSFLRSRRAVRPLAGFQKTNALEFINQRNCAR